MLRTLHLIQRHVVNTFGRRLPFTMVETTGRKSRGPRHTAVGAQVIGTQFWMVSAHGERSDYVLNIKANPQVRARIGGQWGSGTAHLMLSDDPVARLRRLPRLNSAVVRIVGSDLLTIRIDLDSLVVNAYAARPHTLESSTTAPLHRSSSQGRS